MDPAKVIDQYAEQLRKELTFNSKPIINNLTIFAEQYKDLSTGVPAGLVKVILSHLEKVRVKSINETYSYTSFPFDIHKQINAELKLPTLYLIDSILKNVGAPYITVFPEHHLDSVIVAVYRIVDDPTKRNILKVLQTWHSIFPVEFIRKIEAGIFGQDFLANPKPVEFHVEESEQTLQAGSAGQILVTIPLAKLVLQIKAYLEGKIPPSTAGMDTLFARLEEISVKMEQQLPTGSEPILNTKIAIDMRDRFHRYGRTATLEVIRYMMDNCGSSGRAAFQEAVCELNKIEEARRAAAKSAEIHDVRKSASTPPSRKRSISPPSTRSRDRDSEDLHRRDRDTRDRDREREPSRDRERDRKREREREREKEREREQRERERERERERLRERERERERWERDQRMHEERERERREEESKRKRVSEPSITNPISFLTPEALMALQISLGSTVSITPVLPDPREIFLSTSSISQYRPGLHKVLIMNDQRQQCKTCGFRFCQQDTEQGVQAAHMDAHFRRNLRVLQKGKKKGEIIRGWFPNLNQWATHPTFRDQAKSTLSNTTAKIEDVDLNASKEFEKALLPEEHIVTATEDELTQEVKCKICKDSLRVQWDAGRDEWVFKDVKILSHGHDDRSLAHIACS